MINIPDLPESFKAKTMQHHCHCKTWEQGKCTCAEAAYQYVSVECKDCRELELSVDITAEPGYKYCQMCIEGYKQQWQEYVQGHKWRFLGPASEEYNRRLHIEVPGTPNGVIARLDGKKDDVPVIQPRKATDTLTQIMKYASELKKQEREKELANLNKNFYNLLDIPSRHTEEIAPIAVEYGDKEYFPVGKKTSLIPLVSRISDIYSNIYIVENYAAQTIEIRNTLTGEMRFLYMQDIMNLRTFNTDVVIDELSDKLIDAITEVGGINRTNRTNSTGPR